MKINIKGAIVRNNNKFIYDWMEMDAVAPKDVIKAIESAKDGEELDVEIASGGGDIYAGSEIYTALKDYKGNVVVKIVGLAGSAASIIAMAGKKIKMSPTGQIMIHCASIVAGGNSKTFEHISEVLDSHDIGIANAYMLKTGKSQNEVLNLMDKETYFNAKTALENGFIDEIMFDDEMKLSAEVGNGIISEKVIEEMRSYLAKQKEDPEPPTPPENGEVTPEPVSHIATETEQETAVKAQQKAFARIKNKIYGGITK